MNRPNYWAHVEITPPFADDPDKPTLELHFATTPGRPSVSVQISEETARILVDRIQDKLNDLAVARAAAEDRERVRRAMNRRDFHVNPQWVKCARDVCNNRLYAEGGKHPWELAVHSGWRTHFDTDLICPEH